MKKLQVKTALWGVFLSAYLLIICAVVGFFLLPDFNHYDSAERESSNNVINPLMQSVLSWIDPFYAYDAVLLPRGPRDGALPGELFLWEQFHAASADESPATQVGEFITIQGVTGQDNFFRGAVSELFLFKAPRKVFRRGHFLYTWSGPGRVEIIDCSDPAFPKHSGMLPYQDIEFVTMRGAYLFLMLNSPATVKREVVVLDLDVLKKVTEVARFKLPEGATSFFFTADRQIVVNHGVRGYRHEKTLSWYKFDEEYNLTYLNSAKNDLLRNDFFRFHDYLLVPGSQAGLDIIDISQPHQPKVLASVDIPRVRSLTGQGQMLFVLCSDKRVYVIDISEPLKPRLVGSSAPVKSFASLLKLDQYTYYFTENGYLYAHATPLYSTVVNQTLPDFLNGDLLPKPDEDGFLFLGQTGESFPHNIVKQVSLPQNLNVVDGLLWQNKLVLLDNQALIHFYLVGEGAPPALHQSLALPGPREWLEVTEERLYVGGRGSIEVVAEVDNLRFEVTGQISLDGRESQDALAVNKHLYVAAGRAGLLDFSLGQVDHPQELRPLTLPDHLRPQVDVRSLIGAGEHGLIFSAGPAGVFRAGFDSSGMLELDGVYHFAAPVRAVAFIDGACLVATDNEIKVLDARSQESFQLLGDIQMPGVDRFVVSSSGSWGSHVPARGWLISPPPRFLSSTELDRLLADREETLSTTGRNDYRLKLFNGYKSKTAAGFFSEPQNLVNSSDNRSGL